MTLCPDHDSVHVSVYVYVRVCIILIIPFKTMFFFLVVLTPHVGSAEVSVRVKMAKLAAENILAVLDGKPMVTPVPLG